MAKHFELTITETSFAFAPKREQIAAEAALDGLYVIRTSLPAQALSAQQAVASYNNMIHLLDPRTSRPTKTLQSSGTAVYGAAFAQDGR